MTEAALKPPVIESAYQTDFCAWAEERTRLLRAKHFNEFDEPNLIDEVLSVEEANGSRSRAGSTFCSGICSNGCTSPVTATAIGLARFWSSASGSRG